MVVKPSLLLCLVIGCTIIKLNVVTAQIRHCNPLDPSCSGGIIIPDLMDEQEPITGVTDVDADTVSKDQKLADDTELDTGTVSEDSIDNNEDTGSEDETKGN